LLLLGFYQLFRSCSLLEKVEEGWMGTVSVEKGRNGSLRVDKGPKESKGVEMGRNLQPIQASPQKNNPRHKQQKTARSRSQSIL
jgi:hypothetical protein